MRAKKKFRRIKVKTIRNLQKEMTKTTRRSKRSQPICHLIGQSMSKTSLNNKTIKKSRLKAPKTSTKK